MNGSEPRDPEMDRENFVEDEDCLPPTRAWNTDKERITLGAELVDPCRNGSVHCTCPPSDKRNSETQIVLRAADMKTALLLDKPESERTSKENRAVRKYKREQFAKEFSFVDDIDRFDLRIRYWGIGMDDEGAPENTGIPLPLSHENGTIPDKVWVEELKQENHKRMTINQGMVTMVTCTWKIVQGKKSGKPRWLFLSLGKSHNLSFHSSEHRIKTGTRREVVMVDLAKAVEAVREAQGFVPISIRTPMGCRRCNKNRYRLGEYSLEVTPEILDKEKTCWTIVLQTVTNTFRAT